MSSDEAVVLSAANLDVLEDNLSSLANNLGDLSSNMSLVDTKVNDVTNTVKTLEEEIKNFMFEIRESTIVSNAKQSILMAESELKKKYGHYDNVRRKISGLLQSADLNAIKISTIESMSENVLMSTPDYWLSPALVALSAWFTNNKELAYRSLSEALKRDDEKTSLLFCLIHLRAGRNETALLWLKRYLNKQDPLKMESKFITVLDAVSSGVFGPSAKSIVIDKINEWLKLLNNENEIKEAQTNRWLNKLNSLTIINTSLKFPYLEKYTSSSNLVKNSFNKITSKRNILDYFNSLIKENNLKINISKKIDKIINLLIFNYENEELELKKEIEKNRLIINENGNLTKASDRFKSSGLVYQEKTDIFTILNNIILEKDSIETLPETKKLALALIKENINLAYSKYIENENNNIVENKIKIQSWTSSSVDGKNEKELRNSLNNYINNKNNAYINSEKFINFKMMIVLIISIIVCFLLRNFVQFIILSIGLAIAYCAFEVYNTYKRRNEKINRVNKEKEEAQSILQNIICEIVDYNFLIKETNTINEQIKYLLNNLNYENYINTNAQRNIIVGENNDRK